MKRTQIESSAEAAFARLEEQLRASKRPQIPEGYKTTRELMEVTKLSRYRTQEVLNEGCAAGLVERKQITVNGYKTNFYKL